MDLFTAYELCEEFTLHDVSYLLDGYEPLPPGFSPKNDPHERIRHRAGMLAQQLVNDAKTGKLRATYKDYGGVFLLGGPWEWTVKRNDLKDWAKRKMIRPAFLFPQLPDLNSIRNVATAEAYRFGTQGKVFELEYQRALLRIAKQINKGQVVAYVRDSDGEFAKLQGDDSLIFQMRGFLAKGAKSEHCLTIVREAQPMAESTAAESLISTSMDWADRIHIPTEVAHAKPATEPQKISPMKSRPREAKQGMGGDILTPLIEKVIRDVGSEEFSAVFPRLRELALNGESPFTGFLGDEDGALCYRNPENKLDKLTINALQKRLQRRRGGRGH
jgi:hypothetical protein